MLHRPGWSVLFLDDDDIPELDLLRRLWAAHLEDTRALVAGRLVRGGGSNNEDPPEWQLVKYHGASTLLIPDSLVKDCVSWLPEWLDACGGEDTAICSEARKRGIRIWELGRATAREIKPTE